MNRKVNKVFTTFAAWKASIVAEPQMIDMAFISSIGALVISTGSEWILTMPTKFDRAGTANASVVAALPPSTVVDIDFSSAVETADSAIKQAFGDAWAAGLTKAEVIFKGNIKNTVPPGYAGGVLRIVQSNGITSKYNVLENTGITPREDYLNFTVNGPVTMVSASVVMPLIQVQQDGLAPTDADMRGEVASVTFNV